MDPMLEASTSQILEPRASTDSLSSDSAFTNGAAASMLEKVSLDEEEEEEEEKGDRTKQTNGHGDDGDISARVSVLEAELSRTRAEKETLEGQYRGLLGKLTAMRNTLGDKLKQDADELDRRGQQIAQLQSTNDDLSSTVETLKNELISSNEEAEHAHNEMEELRSRALDSQRQTSDEASEREAMLREAQEDLERLRMQMEEWETEAMRERTRRETAETRMSQLEVEATNLGSEIERIRMERDREAESSANLHLVLEEFQTAKDRELKSLLGDLQTQLQTTSKSLADYKQRATLAETKLQAVQTDSERSLALAREVKEKNLLIGKLRHEAVIINEHLTEALRRLKKDTTENNVDRRLVTNVLISFFNTPRADSKRFEMLQVLASILSWSDEERERVGLQRSLGPSSAERSPVGVSASSSRSGKGHSRGPRSKTDGLAENETFSDLWIEFLLREANQATSPSGGPLSASAGNTRFPLPDMSSPVMTPSTSSARRPSFTGSTMSLSSVASSVALPAPREETS